MFSSIIGTSITVTSFCICLGVSLILGLIISYVHMKTCRSNKNFIFTLAILPIISCMVILLVNGNLGTSVVLMGAFSLVRFRSLPGSSREMLSVFFAMVVGLALGTGYIAYGVLFTILVSLVMIILSTINFGNNVEKYKVLKILVPEDLDYTDIFDDIFDKYIDKYELINTKTTNMGSLFELTYEVVLKKNIKEKELIDKIRVRNGNLKVQLSHPINEGEL